MNLARKITFVLTLAACPACLLHATTSAAARVIILANSNDDGSMRIARHYAEVRSVPAANIVSLSMPQSETITWNEFVTTIWQPLQDELVRRKWIDAIPMDLTDGAGRKKNAISGHRISYLVVCRGVPLRISHDPERYHPHPPITDIPYFRTNEGAVDSELSLLAVTDSQINAFLANPLFDNNRPTSLQLNQVVKVSRLDGPTVEDAMALPDRAIEAERTGLLGRAYVDIGGLRPEGDRWLEKVAAQLTDLGFDTDVDRAPATLPVSARIDAPVFYFGWYAATLNGPFTLPGFHFPPGAVALHIHSTSARTLRSDHTGWTGPLVARGVTATVGNVFEPYLQLLHRPDLMLRSLARGDTFGDAAYYAEPVLSWQAIAIGDPLYRPFAVPFGEQWKNRAALPAGLAGYATLREARRLEAANRPAEAFAVLRESQKKHQSLAVGYALARSLEQSGDGAGAARELSFAANLTSFPPNEWSLAHVAAQLLQRGGRPATAVRLYLHLMEDPALPPELRETWLGDARSAAQAAGDGDHAAAWTPTGESLPAGTKK